MNSKEAQRAQVLTTILAGHLTVSQATVVLGVSERSVFRLLAVMKADGPAGLAHGNRGRPSPRRIGERTVGQVVELAQSTYRGANISHLTDLLEEREGISLGRSTVQRIAEAHGFNPGKKRRPRHRSRRERRPMEGMLLQLDASHHDWLEGRGPRLALLGAVDDATSRLEAARFELVEDSAGYMELMREVITTRGLPQSLYTDKHSIFRPTRRESIEDQLAAKEPLSQFGRAMEELDIALIFAHSPQAKGRVERLWGTLQDRLVTELRLAGATTLEDANAVLKAYFPRHNRRFADPPAAEGSAYRPLSSKQDLKAALCAKYSRVVTRDNTVRCAPSGHRPLGFQILPGPNNRSYAGKRVEIREYPDGAAEVVLDGRVLAARMLTVRELMKPPRAASPGRTAELASLAPPRGEQLILPAAAGDVSRRDGARPPASGRVPPPSHPWKKFPAVTKSLGT